MTKNFPEKAVASQEGNNMGRDTQHERTQSLRRNHSSFWITESHRGWGGGVTGAGTARLKRHSSVGSLHMKGIIFSSY